MNRIFIVGNMTGDIHFATVNRNGTERPFMRVLLMSNRPRIVQSLRVVMWDNLATTYYPFLRRGTELGIFGHLVTREHGGKIVYEIEATNVVLLRNINTEAGDHKPTPRANSTFVIGTVGPDIHFEWRTDEGEGKHQYAFMRLLLTNPEGDGSHEIIQDLRVVTVGNLARLAYPYLRDGSVIAVDGHIQTRARNEAQKVVEIVAEHMVFLDNIDWEAGAAAQKAMMGE